MGKMRTWIENNLSRNNAGGFIEILGTNFNCSYRNNVSINDGHRIKGKENAFQEGKTFWLSGYSGKGNERKGPYNSYVYGNYVYVGKEITPCRRHIVCVTSGLFHLCDVNVQQCRTSLAMLISRAWCMLRALRCVALLPGVRGWIFSADGGSSPSQQIVRWWIFAYY